MIINKRIFQQIFRWLQIETEVTETAGKFSLPIGHNYQQV